MLRGWVCVRVRGVRVFSPEPHSVVHAPFPSVSSTQWYSERGQQNTNTRTYGSKQWSRIATVLASDGSVWGDARPGMELASIRRPPPPPQGASPDLSSASTGSIVSLAVAPDAGGAALQGDWELLAFEGPQRQRKKLVRSKKKLVLARDRRGEDVGDDQCSEDQASVEGGSTVSGGGGGDGGVLGGVAALRARVTPVRGVDVGHRDLDRERGGDGDAGVATRSPVRARAPPAINCSSLDSDDVDVDVEIASADGSAWCGRLGGGGMRGTHRLPLLPHCVLL